MRVIVRWHTNLLGLSNTKSILPEVALYKKVYRFSKRICPKVNVIAWLEFELAYYISAVQRFNHYTTRTPSVCVCNFSFWYKESTISFSMLHSLLINNVLKWHPSPSAHRICCVCVYVYIYIYIYKYIYIYMYINVCVSVCVCVYLTENYV